VADPSNLSDAKRNLLEKYLRGQAQPHTDKKWLIPPRATGNTAPLSFSQQQVWLHSQIAPKEVPLYNETLTIRRKGPLDVEVLSRTLNEIVRRHEIWRTTFDVVDGEPVQIIHAPESDFDFPTIDLRDLCPEQRIEDAVRLASDEACKPFDLRDGPLRRALLVRLADDEYRLYLTFHQLIFDGVTAYQVFLPELTAIYHAFSQGLPSLLAEPAIQYADYAIWQQHNSQQLAGAQLEYWQQALKGELPVLDWPLHRPSALAHRGEVQPFFLDAELLHSLRALSRERGVSLLVILAAGLSALLHRYAGQDGIMLGAPTAGRNLPQLQGMLGYFLNILPLRIDVSCDPTVGELLCRVKEAVLGALAHQEVPFTRLLETIRSTPDPSRNAFFQVALSLEPPLKVINNGWTATQSDIPTGSSKLDLYIDLDERPDGICGPVTYNPDIFGAGTIIRMLEHWRRLLATAAANPLTRVSQLPILSAQERHQVLVEWNATQADYPRDKCIHDLFAEQCRRTPDAIALHHRGESRTFQALDRASNQLANHLRKARVVPGGRVAVCLERSPEFVLATLAISKVGAAYVPLDPSYPSDRLAFMLQDCAPQALITAPGFLDKIPNHGIPMLCLDRKLSDTVDESPKPLPPLARPDDPAYLIYTSGSTGKPRGVIGTHRECLNRFFWMWREYPFEAGEVCCHKTSLSFVDSIWEIFGPLLAGVPNVIIPDEVVRDPEELLQTLATNRVTRMVLVPSLLRSLLDHTPNLAARVPHLKLWSCSGEVLTVELAKRFRAAHPTARLLNIYGSSEVAADVTCYEVNQLDGHSSVPIGRPISNTQIYILDNYSNPIAPGTRGEIYVGGDCVAAGYWQRPELTNERFVKNRVDRAGTLFRTGDLGSWFENGDIEYLGRIDNQVKLRGMRVELGEVEAVLACHSKVREAAVALSGEGDQQQLLAYLTAVKGQPPSWEELRRYLRVKLPDHMVPSGYILLQRLPLLPSGKVDRKALAAASGTALAEQRQIVLPRTALEMRLAEIWQELLHFEHIGLEQNFFELGGHSLLVLQMIARIRKTFAIEIPVRIVFERPTIAELAQEVQKALVTGQKPRAPVPPWKARTVAAGGDAEDFLAELDKLPPTDAQLILRRVLEGKQSV